MLWRDVLAGVRRFFSRDASLLWLMVAVGLLLRAWGAQGAENAEETWVIELVRRFYDGALDPEGKIAYPTVFQYLFAGVLRMGAWLYAVARWALGSTGAILIPGLERESIYVPGRLFVAVLGVATIPLTYRASRVLFPDRRVALWASVALCLCFLHVDHSHYAILDVPMTFMCMIAFLAVLELFRKGRWGDYILAGFLAGLAAWTKYGAVFMVTVIIVAHFLRMGRRPLQALGAALGVLLATGAAIVAFKIYVSAEVNADAVGFLAAGIVFIAAAVTLACRHPGRGKLGAAVLSIVPAIVIANPYAFISRVRFEDFLERLGRFGSSNIKGNAWENAPVYENLMERIRDHQYYRGIENLNLALGLGLLLLAAVGLVWALRKRRKEDILLLCFPVLYFLVALRLLGYSRPRDLVVLMPFMAILSGLGWVWVADLLGRIRTKGVGEAVTWCLGVLILATPAFRIARHDFFFREPDTRESAKQWFEESVPRGSTVVYEGYCPEPNRAVFKVRTKRFLHYFAPENLRRDGTKFAMTSSKGAGRFLKYPRRYPDEIAFYRDLEAGAELIKEFSLFETTWMNPVIRLYNLDHAPVSGAAPLWHPRIYWRERSAYEHVYQDGLYRGKDLTGVLLERGRKKLRLLVSREPVDELVVGIIGCWSDSRVRARAGFLGATVRSPAASRSSVIIRAGNTFPFVEGARRLELIPGRASNCFVKVAVEPRDAAHLLLETEDWEAAARFFRKSLLQRTSWREDTLFLALVLERSGDAEGARELISELRASSPEFLEGYRRLAEGGLDEESWDELYEQVTGVDVDLVRSTLTNSFESEHLSRRVIRKGKVRDRWIYHSDGEKNGFVFFGPYACLEPGEYEAIFTMMTDDIAAHEPAVRVDVAERTGEKVLASRVLSGTDFGKSMVTQDFVLAFTVREFVRDLEMRVEVVSPINLWVDRTAVRPHLARSVAGNWRLVGPLVEGEAK